MEEDCKGWFGGLPLLRRSADLVYPGDRVQEWIEEEISRRARRAQTARPAMAANPRPTPTQGKRVNSSRDGAFSGSRIASPAVEFACTGAVTLAPGGAVTT